MASSLLFSSCTFTMDDYGTYDVTVTAKADGYVSTECKFAVLGRRTVCNNLSLLYMLALEYDGLLVVAVRLVTSGEFCQMIFIHFTIITCHFN